MDILITGQSLDPEGTSHIQATAGKVSAYVSQYQAQWVTVCCQNAAHRVHRSGGRTFPTWQEALDAYKSPEMKAIITAARNFFQPAPANVIEFQPA